MAFLFRLASTHVRVLGATAGLLGSTWLVQPQPQAAVGWRRPTTSLIACAGGDVDDVLAGDARKRRRIPTIAYGHSGQWPLIALDATIEALGRDNVEANT